MILLWQQLVVVHRQQKRFANRQGRHAGMIFLVGHFWVLLDMKRLAWPVRTGMASPFVAEIVLEETDLEQWLGRKSSLMPEPSTAVTAREP